MAAPADRRTIAELAARYDLEPSLRDVFVEGPSDRTLVDLAMTFLGENARIRAYEVDTVNVPAESVKARSLPEGNKGRVMALADELATGSSRDLRASVVCLADLDLDDILGRRREYQLLLYTSALSLDVVIAAPEVIEKLLSLVLLGFPQPAGRLLQQLLPVLNERVLQRLAAEQLSITAEPPPLAKSCTFDGRALQFKARDFVRRYLDKAKAVRLQSQFWEAVEQHRAAVAREPNKYVHMDDFFELLHFCAHKVKPKLVPEYSRFRRFMFGFVEGRMVATLPEIQEIATRLGSGVRSDEI